MWGREGGEREGWWPGRVTTLVSCGEGAGQAQVYWYSNLTSSILPSTALTPFLPGVDAPGPPPGPALQPALQRAVELATGDTAAKPDSNTESC